MKLDEKKWRALCAKFATERRVEEWFSKIARHYNEPHRHYHNAEHISHCLAEFRSAPKLAAHPDELELALWLHDVIYDPRRGDNEEQSAEFARALCRDARIENSFAQRVADLILATKHNAAPVDQEAQLVVDIDLAILGQPEERFWRYEAEIRAEYSFVPEGVFRSKRAEILERFLERKRIYATDFFFAKYEALARNNLTKSIEKLRARL